MDSKDRGQRLQCSLTMVGSSGGKHQGEWQSETKGAAPHRWGPGHRKQPGRAPPAPDVTELESTQALQCGSFSSGRRHCGLLQLLSCLVVWLLCWTVRGSLEGPSYQSEPFLPRIAWILTADRPWAKTRPLLYTHSVKNSLGSSWTKNYLTFLLLLFLRGRSQ